MKIVLSGVESNNKGAELMLYAILQEIHRVHPDAIVYIERSMLKQGLDYIHTPVHLEYLPISKIQKFFSKCKITGTLNRIGLYSNYLNRSCPIQDVDYFIDGSGLLFSDKRIKNNMTAVVWRKKLQAYKKCGTKIVFLPQGFGPFDKESSRRTICALDTYADVIFAREEVSLNLLLNRVKNKYKVILSPDFTALVDGVISSRYERLANKVCVIPNVQMINKGVMSKEEYFEVMKIIVTTCKSEGYDVYLLNHEGAKDEALAKDFIDKYDKSLELVTGLNALEVKGLISTAYLVISSRFHGVASSLNGGVPCLATSWHHKYEELFKDYGLENCVIPLKDNNMIRERVKKYLNRQMNTEIRRVIESNKPKIVEKNLSMWKSIWS